MIWYLFASTLVLLAGVIAWEIRGFIKDRKRNRLHRLWKRRQQLKRMHARWWNRGHRNCEIQQNLAYRFNRTNVGSN